MATLGSKNPKNLKALLDAGEITKDEYESLMKKHKERLTKKGGRKMGLIEMLRGK